MKRQLRHGVSGLEPKSVCNQLCDGSCLSDCYFCGYMAILTNSLRERSDSGSACAQHRSIHNGAPGDVPDIRTHTYIDSANVTTGQQNLMQAICLVNRNLSS